MKPSHWAHLGESTFVLGIWGLYGAYRLFGRGPFRLLLYPVVLVYWLTRGTARRASLEYLRRLHEAQAVFARTPGWRESLRHFFLFGETLLDKMLAVGGRYERDRVEFHGQEAIVDALRAGKGGLFVTAHLGCLELTQTVAAHREGLRLTVLVHTAHAERFNRVLARLDPTATVRLLQVESFSPAMAMLLSDRVAAGEYIAIAGDRIPVRGDRLASARFLGRMAPFPTGPYLIASLLGCPVYALACLHHGDGYRVSIERLSDRIVLPRATRTEALANEAARFATWIETRLRESPYDWFNFFPFWDQTPHALPNE